MTEVAALLPALALGLMLGALFFGGLWWTVSRSLTARVPAVWFGLSALVRMAVVVSGLYCFARLGWPNLIACLCGLLAARGAVKHFIRIAA